MKHILKTAGSLLLDQFIGSIAACMLVVCVAVLFKQSLLGFVLAFVIAFAFYAYITYNSSFKAGFRNVNRIQHDPSYKAYWYNGALAGLISAIPLLGFFIWFLISGAGIVAVYFMICDMYWTWPLSNIFPNHRLLVMCLAFLPIIVIPWIGYIAGYKNFLLSDVAMKFYKKITDKSE